MGTPHAYPAIFATSPMSRTTREIAVTCTTVAMRSSPR